MLNLTAPRTDCPMHLPEAPPPAKGYSWENEAALPINGLQEDIMMMHASVMGEEFPSHIKTQVFHFTPSPLSSANLVFSSKGSNGRVGSRQVLPTLGYHPKMERYQTKKLEGSQGERGSSRDLSCSQQASRMD